MKKRTKSSNSNEESFISELDKGKDLCAEYEYEKDERRFYLEFSAGRYREESKLIYCLTIREGDHAADEYHDYCSIRDDRYEFSTATELLEFLKKDPQFNIKDWGYSFNSEVMI